MKQKPLLKFELEENNPLSVVLYVFGVIALLGGFILTIILWPDSSSLEAGYVYKAIAYLPALSCLAGGLISCALFLSIGQILHLLQCQFITLQHIATELERQGWENKIEEPESEEHQNTDNDTPKIPSHNGSFITTDTGFGPLLK